MPICVKVGERERWVVPRERRRVRLTFVGGATGSCLGGMVTGALGISEGGVVVDDFADVGWVLDLVGFTSRGMEEREARGEDVSAVVGFF